MDRLVERQHLALERLIGLLFILVALVEAYLSARGWLSSDLLLPTITILLIVSLSPILYAKSGPENVNVSLYLLDISRYDVKTGEFTADDLLGEIFSRFCIGK
jgi:hypothetical protein